ncbi:hypothetical protein CALCODRAFT_55398 [Calocera cornea HHB12733]|uniref:Uncharacterized protein n=1 Tax=Calocera cornea HHB12733 TaxID=1353952 RepID=A0A165DQJ4_9BASI|nr:hypothetical protein CALCODRAFT_55398 [Calocera cornea HHB12733]
MCATGPIRHTDRHGQSFKHPRSPDATERSNAEAFSIPAAPPVGTQVVPTEQPLESVYQHLVLDTMFQNRIVVNSQLLRTDPRAQQHIRHCLAAAPRMLFNDHRRGAHALLGWFRGVDAILSTALTLARVGAAEPKTLLAGESALWHCKLMAILEGLQAMISPLDQCIQKIRNSMQMVEEQHHSTAAAITPASSNNVNPSSRRVPATHERRPSFITPRDSLYLEVVLPALNNIRAKNAGTVPAQPGPQAIIRHLLASAPDFLTRDWNASPIYVTGWALGLHELIDAIRGMREQGGLSWDTVLSATTTLDYTIRLAQELRIEDQTLSHMFAGALAKLEALYDPDDRTKFMGVQVRN